MSEIKVIWTNQFKKDYKNAIKRNFDIDLLDDVILQLSKGKTLDLKYQDHQLLGNFQSFRECHIKPNWLLIYKIDKSKLILVLSRTGSHSDLFGQ
jgi:mRNA interferase YafQ